MMLTRWHIVLGLSAGMLLPSLSHALTVGNIEVKSAVNEPFRAKVPLRNITVPLSSINTQMASSNDYARLGIDRNLAPNLKFTIQDNGNGNAVLWLSSNEPVASEQVDLLISVGNQQDRTLHQMSAALKPARQRLQPQTSEQPLLTNTGDTPLIPSRSAPPPMSASTPNVSLPVVSQDTPTTTPKVTIDTSASETAAVSMDDHLVVEDETTSASVSTTVVDPIVNSYPQAAATTSVVAPAVDKPKPTSRPNKSTSRSNYRVVRRDTLWDIAMRVSKQHNMPINKVMDSIQAINQDAFIRNNRNLLREGVELTIPRYDEISELARSFQKSKGAMAGKASAKSKRKAKKSLSATKQKARSKKRKNKSKRITAKSQAKRQSKKRVQRLKKAEMSIIAPTQQGSAQGESQRGSAATGVKSLPPQIKAQITKSRTATIQQRKRVNKLNTELSSFSQKIKLQNARLAELENRLKQLNKK